MVMSESECEGEGVGVGLGETFAIIYRSNVRCYSRVSGINDWTRFATRQHNILHSVNVLHTKYLCIVC